MQSNIWRNSLKDLRGKQLAKNSGSKVKQIYNKLVKTLSHGQVLILELPSITLVTALHVQYARILLPVTNTHDVTQLVTCSITIVRGILGIRCYGNLRLSAPFSKQWKYEPFEFFLFWLVFRGKNRSRMKAVLPGVNENRTAIWEHQDLAQVKLRSFKMKSQNESDVNFNFPLESTKAVTFI